MSTRKKEMSSVAASLGSAAALAVVAAVMAPPAQAASAAPGLTIAKDSASGQLRAPTAAEAAALSAAPAGSYQARGLITGKINPTAIKHRDGTIEQELDESTQSFSIATRNPDGSITTQCVTGAEAANAVLSKASKGSAKLVKAAKEQSYEQK